VQAEGDRHERMTVPVTINGQGPYRFLVDTGAQATVITARVTDALGLVPSGKATLIAMASRSTVETVALDGLEFAGRRIGGLTTALLRDQHLGADGIIGLDSLQDLRVIIDFRADAISVADASGADRAGYEIVVRARRKLGQMIITDARVDGVRTAVVIDTGSWHSLGNRALQRRLRARRSDSMMFTDVVGATLQSTGAMIDRLEIGRIGLTEVPVGFTESPAFAALGLADKPALILGMGNLRPFERVAIDFASRRVLFDVPKGAAPSRLDSLFTAQGGIGG
jgi:predicted aspartyl protease